MIGCVTALGPEGPISKVKSGNINPIPFRSDRGSPVEAPCKEGACARCLRPLSDRELAVRYSALTGKAWPGFGAFQSDIVWTLGVRSATARRLARSPFRTEFSDLLGPTDPCPTAVHMEPFSTSVYKVLICILATTTKICTEGGSTRARAQRFNATDAPPYSSEPAIGCSLLRRPGMSGTLQRHPFSGLVDSAGELLHTP